MNNDEPFLKRWSRRKVEAKERAPGDSDPVVEGDTAGRVPGPQDGEQNVGEQAERQEARLLTEEDFADVDFDALDAQSDYSRFLAQGVPDSIKYRALRKLWASDPILSQIEPMQEYAGDFTDAAVAVPAGSLKTAYRVGKGFMTDEEVAEWEQLGKPVEEKVAAAAPVMDAEKRIAHEAAGAGDPAAGHPADAADGERQAADTSQAKLETADAEAEDEAAPRPAGELNGSARAADKSTGKA